MSQRNDAPASLSGLIRTIVALAFVSIITKIGPPEGPKYRRASDPQERGPEPPGIHGGVVAGIGLGFVAFAVLSGFGLYLYMTAFIHGPLIKPEQHFPEPGLAFVHEAADLRRQQVDSIAREQTRDGRSPLNSIPIEEAMRRVVARGNDAFSAVQKPETPPGYARTGAGPMQRSGP